MSRYSALLARSLGWSESDTELMLNASPMHDIGKIGIPDSILLKPGRLDERERDIMQRHTEIGATIFPGPSCSGYGTAGLRRGSGWWLSWCPIPGPASHAGANIDSLRTSN